MIKRAAKCSFLSVFISIVFAMTIGVSCALADMGGVDVQPNANASDAQTNSGILGTWAFADSMQALDGEGDTPSADPDPMQQLTKALQEAIAAARAVAADENASQEVRDQAYAALEKAVGQYLLAAGITDRASLEKALQDVAKQITEGIVISEDGSDVPSTQYWVTQEMADGLTNAFTEFIAAIQKEGITPSEANEAFEKLRTGVSTYIPKQGALDPEPGPEPEPQPAVNTAKLEKAIADAKKAQEGVKVSVDGADVDLGEMWVNDPVKSAFDAVIVAAQSVLDKPDATQEQVDATAATVTAAQTAFEAAKKQGTKKTGPAQWKRLAGAGALDTMNAIVDEGGFEKGGTVVLASLEGYWDALTAAGIAGLENAPVLMVLQDDLGAQAEAQLKKLAPKKIIVCGGTYWIPDFVVVEACNAAGVASDAVVRLAGDNAAITAAKIAEAGKGKWEKTAIVATAGTFQDALAAAPVSYAKAMPIFLAQFDSAKEEGYITADTVKAMQGAGVKQCYIAGGTYWLPAQVKSDLEKAGIKVLGQLGGKSAVETSGLIAELATGTLGMSADKMGAANVAQHYDALASAAFCGKNNGVLVLVSDANRSVVDSFVKPNAAKISAGYVFGGTGSVSDASKAALEAATK